MGNTEKLKETLERCGAVGSKVLEGEGQGAEYTEALLCLLDILKDIDDDEIKTAGYPANIEGTIRMDKRLIGTDVTNEFDQLSLLSTLATYVECNSEGRPGHNAEYMDRVTALRKVIEEVYGEEAMRFCGIDGC
jgi:hypothetical protein